jgi:hypothetical protein
MVAMVDIKKYFTKEYMRGVLDKLLKEQYKGRPAYEVKDYTPDEIVSNIWLDENASEIAPGTGRHRYEYAIWRKYKNGRTGKMIESKTGYAVRLFAADSKYPNRLSTNSGYHKGDFERAIESMLWVIISCYLKDNTETPMYNL